MGERENMYMEFQLDENDKPPHGVLENEQFATEVEQGMKSEELEYAFNGMTDVDSYVRNTLSQTEWLVNRDIGSSTKELEISFNGIIDVDSYVRNILSKTDCLITKKKDLPTGQNQEILSTRLKQGFEGGDVGLSIKRKKISPEIQARVGRVEKLGKSPVLRARVSHNVIIPQRAVQKVNKIKRRISTPGIKQSLITSSFSPKTTAVAGDKESRQSREEDN